MLSKSMFKGMNTFMVIWAGQLVSLLGSAMTRFALMIWAYEQTHQATTLALLAFFQMASALVASPLAGMAVDRFNRRTIMLLADTGSGLVTVALLALYSTSHLQIWHMYAAETLGGFFETFQLAAYLTATTLIVPREQFARASALRSTARSVGRVIAPFAAGMLLPFIRIDGVMIIDVATFLVALATMLAVAIPQPPVSELGAHAHSDLVGSMRFGIRFIWDRPGLFGLVLFVALVSFFSALTYFGTLPAMLLSRQGGGQMTLATVQSAMGAGALAGSILASAWGGPRRQIHAVLAGAALSFALGDLVFAFGRDVGWWIAGGFCAEFLIPFIIAGINAIWQAKVPSDVQGRVFAAQSLLSDLATPLGYLIAGPLADRVTEPAMMPGGALAGTLGPLVGTGPGTGIAATFIFTGVIGIAVSLGSYLLHGVRDVETELPDAHDLHGVEAAALAEAAP